MKRAPAMATIETRLCICGEWQNWARTTDGEVRLSTAIDLATMRTADMVRPGVKEYRVKDSKGRVVWPAVQKKAPKTRITRGLQQQELLSAQGFPATPSSSFRVVVDYENNAEAWWDAARFVSNCPATIRDVVHRRRGEASVSGAEIAAVRAWCESLPGWATGPSYARHPLTITEV